MCDIDDGFCKCGMGDSCENKPWSPTCNVLSGSCTCGSKYPCNNGTQSCDEISSTCIDNEGTKQDKNI